MEWAAREGITHKLQYPSYDLNGVKGVAAAKDIETGEVLLRVPYSSCIDAGMARRDPVLAKAFEKHGATFAGDEDAIIAVFLLHEMLKGEASRYFPWIAILPTPDLISNWSDSELAELQDETLAQAARDRNAELNLSVRNTLAALTSACPEAFTNDDATATKLRVCIQVS
jgi:hypothetical protein